MLIKNYQIVFIFMIFTGTITAISAASWFSCWIGLEINLIRFIPLIFNKFNKLSSETVIKYFLPQALSSIIIIFVPLIEIIFTNFNFLPERNIIISIALAIKAGLAPIHFWFPQVIIQIEWFPALIILIWQKIAPYILFFSSSSSFTFWIIISSRIVGRLGGLNQSFTKLILTYSSVAHGAWLLTLTLLSINLWLTYFVIYSIILIPIILLIAHTQIYKISNINKSPISTLVKFNLITRILSLGGLPPFLGFLAKINAIIQIISYINLWLSITLISGSLISLYYYIKILYNLTINLNLQTFISKKTPLIYITFITTLSLTGNLITPMLLYLT